MITIPIKRISIEKKNQLINLVEKFFFIRSTNKNQSTTSLEQKIDQLIYKFYELSYEEASIIEGIPEWISKEEYENFQL